MRSTVKLSEDLTIDGTSKDLRLVEGEAVPVNVPQNFNTPEDFITPPPDLFDDFYKYCKPDDCNRIDTEDNFCLLKAAQVDSDVPDELLTCFCHCCKFYKQNQYSTNTDLSNPNVALFKSVLPVALKFVSKYMIHQDRIHPIHVKQFILDLIDAEKVGITTSTFNNEVFIDYEITMDMEVHHYHVIIGV